MSRLAVRPDQLFVYGTLTFPEVLAAVIGRVPNHVNASAAGWRVAALRDRPFPALVKGSGTVAGILLTDLTETEWRVLDAFEAPAYDLVRIELDGSRRGWAYVVTEPSTGFRILPGTWDRDWFAAHELDAYLRRCEMWRPWFEKAAMAVPARGGTAFEIIDSTLRTQRKYQQFRAGRTTRAAYSDWVESRGDELGLDADKRNLSTRFPEDDHLFVNELLADLAEAGLVADAGYPRDEFDALAATVAERIEHGGRTTFIFPEEARLLFALAHRLRPRNAVFLGSYYGYWAIWALPGVIAAGGRVTLVDLDPAVMALAERNLTALGLAGSVDFVVADAIEYARNECGDVDLCVLDAEGPKLGPDPDRCDKAIYYPITEAVTPAMAPGGILVAHNVLLDNLTENRYFAGRIAHNEAQFGKWLPYLAEHYDLHREYPTTEGVGIYRRTGPSCAE